MRSVRTSHVCNFSWSAPAGWNRFLFHRRFVNCLLKHCEIWKQGQFKHLKAAPISLTIVYAPIASCLFSISRSIQPFSQNSRLFQKISEDNRRFTKTGEESCLQTTQDVQRRNPKICEFFFRRYIHMWRKTFLHCDRYEFFLWQKSL